MKCYRCDKEASEHFYSRFCPDQDEEEVSAFVNGDATDDEDPNLSPEEIFFTYRPAWPRYVNVYEVTQAYGGCEEGGWWYMCGEPIASIPVDSQEELDAALAKEMKRHDLDDQGNYALRGQPNHQDYDVTRARGATSCAGGYDVQVSVQFHFAKPFPEETPHYE